MIFHKIPQRATTRVALLAATMAFVFFSQSAIADYYEYDYFYDTNRMSREHRLAGDVDDWIERGDSTVTASSVFDDGIRLAAWANEFEAGETFEFGIASAIYFFEIPSGTRYIEIKVRYKGEAHEGYLEEYGKLAGRIWIRNTDKEREYRDDDENTDTLYGDTFVLRANRRSETIKIAAANHVDDGLLELHVVAQSGELIDINYIDVVAKIRQPKVQVVHRYVKEYEWDPWYNYTYCYFYAGPHFYVNNHGYYVRWSYPIYDRHYLVVRANYRRYLDRYRRRHGVVVHHYYRPVRNVRIRVYNRDRSRSRRRLTQWTDRHDRVRNEYSRSRFVKKQRDRSQLANTRTRVRQTIEKHRREPVLVDREIQSKRVSLKRRRDADNVDRSSRSSLKTRISTRSQRTDKRKRTSQVKTQPQENRTKIRVRTQRTEPRKERKTEVRQTRTETKKAPSRTKTRKDDDDDDDDDEEEERSKRREARKKRR